MSRYFLGVDVGAAILLPQSEMTPEAIGGLCQSPRGQLLAMAEKARALAKPEAAAEVARVCEESCQRREQ